MAYAEQRPEPEPDGVRWLKLIGRGDLIGVPTKHGQPAEEFPSLCPQNAVDVFISLESLKINDPRREAGIAAARAMIDSHLPVVLPQE